MQVDQAGQVAELQVVALARGNHPHAHPAGSSRRAIGDPQHSLLLRHGGRPALGHDAARPTSRSNARAATPSSSRAWGSRRSSGSASTSCRRTTTEGCRDHFDAPAARAAREGRLVVRNRVVDPTDPTRRFERGGFVTAPAGQGRERVYKHVERSSGLRRAPGSRCDVHAGGGRVGRFRTSLLSL
jgi:hypothetical protein